MKDVRSNMPIYLLKYWNPLLDYLKTTIHFLSIFRRRLRHFTF